MIDTKTIGQSVVKPNNDVFDNGKVRENEDVYLYATDYAALADGAGGSGLYARAWGEYLLLHLPEKSFVSIGELNAWISEFWEVFYDEYSALASSDPFLSNKFEKEGSMATLCALWCNRTTQEVDTVAYGDSMIFHYNKTNGKLLYSSNYEKIKYLTVNPYLLNWVNEDQEEAGFEKISYPLGLDEVVFATSDALGQMIYLIYQQKSDEGRDKLHDYLTVGGILSKYIKQIIVDKPSFGDVMAELLTALNNKKSFGELCYSYWEKGWLHRDDYSMVSIAGSSVGSEVK